MRRIVSPCFSQYGADSRHASAISSLQFRSLTGSLCLAQTLVISYAYRIEKQKAAGIALSRK